MTGFLFDPVYKPLKTENNLNSSASGRKTKSYRDILQFLWRASNMEDGCEGRACGEKKRRGLLGYHKRHERTQFFSPTFSDWGGVGISINEKDCSS